MFLRCLFAALLLLLATPASAQIRPIPVVELQGPGETEGTVLAELSTELPAGWECPWRVGGCASDGYASFKVRPCPPGLACDEDDISVVESAFAADYTISSVQVELLEGVDYSVWGQWTLSVFAEDPLDGCTAYLCVSYGDFASTHVSAVVSASLKSWGVLKARY